MTLLAASSFDCSYVPRGQNNVLFALSLVVLFFLPATCLGRLLVGLGLERVCTTLVPFPLLVVRASVFVLRLFLLLCLSSSRSRGLLEGTGALLDD